MARYSHATDTKGRLVLPAKLREHLGDFVYITNSLDKGYLALYSPEQFEQVNRQLTELPGTEPLARRLRRAIIGEACRVSIDGQGRISLSEPLWSSIGVAPGSVVCLLDMGDSVQLCAEPFYLKERAAELPLAELELSGYDIRGIL